MRPRLLDLYCCAGGAAAGYERAGFEVTGVDIEPQPNYPFEFVQADALSVLADHAFLARFTAVHASPPCQDHSKLARVTGRTHGTGHLLIATRDLLLGQPLPWVLENVDGSGLAEQDDLFGARGLLLCGAMFGLNLYRHRLFEASFPLAAPHHPRHLKPASRAGHWEPGTVISVAGHSLAGPSREAMGIGWMTREELAEAIPPAFTEYIGGQLLAQIREAA